MTGPTSGHGTSNMPQTMQVAALGTLGPKIGDGGQAKIFELPGLTLPDVAGKLVYKQYKPGKAPAHGLARIVGLRLKLLADPVKLARLDAITAWPVRQIVDPTGALRGLVLPRIPDSYFHDVRRSGTGTMRRGPREVQFLIIPPDKALRLGTVTPTPQERLTICRDFAAALAFLHGEMDVTFGDINARNAVFRLGADPMVMFVDCDAVRVRGDMASAPQLNAPDWDPPEGGDVLSQSTDRYKLGLFVLRCLTPDHNSSINRDPMQARGALDAAGLAMLRNALGTVPTQRPSAEEWHRYLRRALGEALIPPRLTRVDVDRTLVPVGQPVTVSWSAEDADTVHLTAAGIPTTTVPGQSGSGTVALLPTHTGTITVTVRNSLGEDSRTTPTVGVFDVPSFQDMPVQMPRFDLPRPTPTDLPDVGAVLPPFDGIPVLPLPVGADGTSWQQPHHAPPPDPLDPAGPPPDFGFGLSAPPIDVTAIMSGSPPSVRPTKRKARP